jgi:hypothetical protein
VTHGAQGLDEQFLGARIDKGHRIRAPREKVPAHARVATQVEKLRELLDLQERRIREYCRPVRLE